MPIRTVESKQNPRLKQLRRALERPGRDLIGLEGPNLVDEALRAGLTLECVFVAQGDRRIDDWLRLADQTEILLLPRPLLDAALTTEAPQPVAALAHIPQAGWSQLLTARPASSPLLLVLAGIQDPGNLGTMARSAEAFGATGLVLLPGAVNPWNPKALRASAGSLFRLPLVHATEDECFEQLQKAGIRTLATTVRDARPAGSVNLSLPSAIFIGNEGNGLTAEIVSRCDENLTIPCPGPVESLNAAIAASILLYEAARQRGCAPSAE